MTGEQARPKAGWSWPREAWPPWSSAPRRRGTAFVARR